MCVFLAATCDVCFPGSDAVWAPPRVNGGGEEAGGGGRRRGGGRGSACEKGMRVQRVGKRKRTPRPWQEQVWFRGTRLRSQSQRAALGSHSWSRLVRPFPAFKRKAILPQWQLGCSCHAPPPSFSFSDFPRHGNGKSSLVTPRSRNRKSSPQIAPRPPQFQSSLVLQRRCKCSRSTIQISKDTPRCQCTRTSNSSHSHHNKQS